MNTICVSFEDANEFVEWAEGRSFCNSGQHICDRLASQFEYVLEENRQIDEEADKIDAAYEQARDDGRIVFEDE